MRTIEKAAPSRGTLNIRIQPELRGLIDRAALFAGKNRSEFVLEAARRAAENTIMERTVFAVEPKVYKEFLARLDAPPRPSARLRRTIATRPPWEK